MQVSNDATVRHLLQTRESSQFITTRIEQIILSVLTDNREHFIDTLLQKLDSLEALYSNQHTKSLRQLGDRIISVATEQNAEEIAHVRKIQLLLDQVHGLQDQVVKMNGERTEKTGATDTFKRYGTKKRFVDPSAPQFYSIFATVNLSDFEVKLKLIQTDAKVTQEMMTVMSRKMREIFAVVKEKVIGFSAMYRKRIHMLVKSEEKAKAKLAELQEHFDSSVVPKLLEKHKEQMAKQREDLMEKTAEVEQLKNDISKATHELKQASDEREQLLNAVHSFEKQSDAYESRILDLESEVASNRSVIENKTEENTELLRLIEQLKSENARLNQQLSEARSQNKELSGSVEKKQTENDKMKKNIEKLIRELDQNKEELDTTKRILEETEEQKSDVEEQLKEEKHKNNDLATKIHELEPRLQDTEQRLGQAKKELKSVTEENRDKTHQISEHEEKIEGLQRQIARLETSLAQAKSTNTRNESMITALEEKEANHERTIGSLEDQLKKEKTTTAVVRNDFLQAQNEISRQKASIETLNNEKDQLQQNLNDSRKQSSKLEAEISKLQGTVASLQSDMQDLTEKNKETEQKLAKSTDDKGEMKKQIKDLSKKITDNERKINEQNAHIDKQKQQKQSLKDKLNESQGQIQELERIKQKHEKKLAENEETIKTLEDNNRELTESLKDTSSKLKQSSEKESQQMKDIEELESKNDELRKVVDHIQNSIPVESMKDLPKAVSDAVKHKQTAEELMKMLSAKDRDSAIQKLEELAQQSGVLSAIQDILPSNLFDLPEHIKNLKEENNRLREQQQKVSQLLSGSSDTDIMRSVQEAIENQSKLTDQLKAATEFVSTVLAIMTGPSIAQTRLTFPLKQSVRDKLIDLVMRIKKRADTDHEQVERVLERARHAGYVGEDVIEAVSYIAMREIESERQQTLSMIGRELDDVQSLSASQKEAYAKDKEEARKKIAKLRESLADQIERASQREQELKEENDGLLKKCRELASDLETERKVREELGRIGAGLSYDKTYLTCKLSKNELRLITLAEQTARTNKPET